MNSRNLTIRAAALLLGLTLVGAGCNDDGGGDDEESAPVDPCTLMDEAAIGDFLGPDTALQYQDPSVCRYAITDVGLELRVLPDQSENRYDQARSTLLNRKAVEGIGEGAEISTEQASMVIYADGNLMFLQLIGAENLAEQEQIEDFLVAQARYAADQL